MKLGLGTAQFGLNYGISNQSGKVSDSELSKIFAFCQSNKINLIDTAQTYGDSEKRVSKYLNNDYKTITKFALDSINNTNTISDCLNTSINNLKTNKIDTFMVHSFNLNSSKKLDDIYINLKHLKLSGAVNRIGVSVYNENEINFILDNYNFDVIQLPLNIFDQKLELTGVLKKIKSKNIEIHVRSAFLQGLCFMNPSHLTGNLTGSKVHINKFQQFAKNANMTYSALALSYLLSIKEIDYVILGCTTEQELSQNYIYINKPQTTIIDYKQFMINDNNITNPSKWDL